MCPDVASLCVYSEDALETSPEGRHGWSVSMQQVVIVLQPVRQNIVGNDSPSALPHLGLKDFSEMQAMEFHQWMEIVRKPVLVKVLQLTYEYSKQKRVDGTSLGKRPYT